jgi:glycine/D-amino acid oxidase-like deaminating enzyme
MNEDRMPQENIQASDSIWHATLSPPERATLSAGAGKIEHPRPDVLVVGGGLVGLATAYFLAEEGLMVQLIEAETLAAGASGANAGGIWPNDQGPAHASGFQTLAFQSRDLWGRLSLRPEFDFDWRVNGFLNLNADRIGPSAPHLAAQLQEQGYAVQAVDGDQIAALEPNLRPGLTAGLHLPSEAHLHPVKAAVSLARGARRRGAGVNPGVSAIGFSARSARIDRVETTAGPIEPRHLVSATGWTARWLAELNEPLPPLRPVSGQLIATNPQPPLIKSAIAGQFLVIQLQSGEIVTGGSVRESDSLAPDDALSRDFAAAARELIPALGDVPFTRAWCGLRPGTPDGLPIIDRARTADNLWLASGHFKNGVLLAPATGRLLAEWIVRGSAPADLSPFRSDRFA